MSAFFFFQAESGTLSPPLVFRPPIRGYTEPWHKDTPTYEREFAVRFRGQARAVNVYKLTDGTYTEIDGLDPSIIDIIYRGSTQTEVSEDEAAELVAAGYDVLYYEP